MLKDVLTEKLDVVFCGTAKGEASARLGYYYAGLGNKFYAILHNAGFTTKRLIPKNCYEINKYNIGLTDLVHCQAGNDKDILTANYDIAGFIVKMQRYKPKYIAFVGKTAASFAMGLDGKTATIAYGIQNGKMGESKVFVLPSTSGSARKYWNEQYWFDLKNAIASERR